MSEEDIKRRHRSVARKLNGHKEKHLYINAHCTSLTGKLEEKTQELVQKEQELDQTKQELNLATALGGVLINICHIITGDTMIC